MFSQSFKFKKRDFLKRKSSIIQTKLKVFLKCYTIFNFELDDSNKRYRFNKSYKINGIRMDDSNTYIGFYEVEDLEDDYVLLILKI